MSTITLTMPKGEVQQVLSVKSGDRVQFRFEAEIEFNALPESPVPDPITADHLEGLCNLLRAVLPYAIKHDPSPFAVSKYERYLRHIQHAEERANLLRGQEN